MENRQICDWNARPRVIYMTTSSLALRFLSGQLRFIREAGYDVTVISAPGEELTRAAESEGVQTIAIPMEREIRPLRDIVSFWRLWRVMRRLQPSITNVGTPKAGLLGGLAAWLAGVPCRVYTLHGLRAETMTGVKRQLLLTCEKLACACAHRVVCVSGSLRKKAVSLGLISAERAEVIRSGSANGMDFSGFASKEAPRSKVQELRQRLGIPEAAPVVGFVGRFTRDKGMTELMEAFVLLRREFPELRLLMVGDFEEGDMPAAEVVKWIKTDPNVVRTGFVDDVAPFYYVMDVLALPTYREGFPNVVLEAQAAGRPAVVTNATGAVDSVVDDVTGLIVPVGDHAALRAALAKLLADSTLAAAMGQNGRKRVAAEFQPMRIWSELARQYRSLLETKGLPLPAGSYPVAERRESVAAAK